MLKFCLLGSHLLSGSLLLGRGCFIGKVTFVVVVPVNVYIFVFLCARARARVSLLS
jgi:hypothetical protein